MCFYKKKLNQKMKRATRDIVVYKILEEIDDSMRRYLNATDRADIVALADSSDKIDSFFVSPVYEFVWELGKTYQAKEKINNRKSYRISKGVFHSYANIEIAKSSIVGSFYSRNMQLYIVSCRFSSAYNLTN